MLRRTRCVQTFLEVGTTTAFLGVTSSFVSREFENSTLHSSKVQLDTSQKAVTGNPLFVVY